MLARPQALGGRHPLRWCGQSHPSTQLSLRIAKDAPGPSNCPLITPVGEGRVLAPTAEITDVYSKDLWPSPGLLCPLALA